MSDDLIRYDILTQEALRRVIRKVLEEVQRTGLPGEHHFFITFVTAFPGVRLSARMLERYPEEMTIVIQHSFWNLEVGDSAFEIDLSFDDIRERLRIPFDSIRGFFDPSVKFGLQFDVAPAAKQPQKQPEAAPAPAAALPAKRPPASVPATRTAPGSALGKPAEEAGAAEDAKAAEPGAEVVSLDSFRKKK
jgi:hypothetical protein